MNFPKIDALQLDSQLDLFTNALLTPDPVPGRVVEDERRPA